MTCYRKLKAYKAPGGGIAFDSKKGYADRPLELPCGQCIGCRVDRSRSWALRCVHEAQMQREAGYGSCFITLTYDDEHVPSDYSLNKGDWQNFARALRYRIGAFRYYMCGEYGDDNRRPHYHALIFGFDFSRDRVLFRGRGANRLYRSATLEDAWRQGFSTVGEMSYSSAAYVSRYCMKKKTGWQSDIEYVRTMQDRDTGEITAYWVEPEFALMSRRPGLGSSWYDKYGESDVVPNDRVLVGGKSFRPPRYYDNKLSEERLSSLKASRIKRAEAHKDDLTDARLRDREYVELLAEEARQRRL